MCFLIGCPSIAKPARPSLPPAAQDQPLPAPKATRPSLIPKGLRLPTRHHIPAIFIRFR